VKSKFGEETLFGTLNLDESGNVENVPRLSRSEVFARMLQKGNASPPQVRAGNMEMEEEETVDIVDLATTKVPYPRYQEYTIKLRPFSAPCFLKLQLAGNEYRNIEAEGEGGRPELICRFNHGHMAEPSLSIRVKKAMMTVLRTTCANDVIQVDTPSDTGS
jgi:hypothetical protein